MKSPARFANSIPRRRPSLSARPSALRAALMHPDRVRLLLAILRLLRLACRGERADYIIAPLAAANWPAARRAGREIQVRRAPLGGAGARSRLRSRRPLFNCVQRRRRLGWECALVRASVCASVRPVRPVPCNKRRRQPPVARRRQKTCYANTFGQTTARRPPLQSGRRAPKNKSASANTRAAGIVRSFARSLGRSTLRNSTQSASAGGNLPLVTRLSRARTSSSCVSASLSACRCVHARGYAFVPAGC